MTVLLISKISSTCFGQTFAHLQERKTEVFYNIAKQLSSYRTHSATLPCSEPLPTTTTGHYTICCKKPQSCTPEDGQKFARNMLSWSWRSIKLSLLHLVGFCITLPTLMMHGQTQEGDIWMLYTMFNFLYSMKSLELDIHVKSQIEPSSVSSTCSWNASDVYNCVAACLFVVFAYLSW